MVLDSGYICKGHLVDMIFLYNHEKKFFFFKNVQSFGCLYEMFSWCRNLHTPLLTYKLHNEFLQAVSKYTTFLLSMETDLRQSDSNQYTVSKWSVQRNPSQKEGIGFRLLMQAFLQEHYLIRALIKLFLSNLRGHFWNNKGVMNESEGSRLKPH